MDEHVQYAVVFSGSELHMDELTHGNMRFKAHKHYNTHKHVHFFHKTEIQMQ